MTQQPYAPNQVPQQYPPAPPVQYAPQYPQAPQQYAQPFIPPYPQQQAPQQQPPAQPLANGSLDDFYNQPGAATGPALSWKDKPIGTAFAGVVARDVTSADVQQETDYKTGAPKFFKDGRPQFVMKVPLKVQPSQEHPEGEATFYVRGQARDELVRAMAEVGCSGAPKGGSVIQVTLVNRRPVPGGNPANVVQIRYQPADGGQGAAPASSGAASPAPEPSPQAPAQVAPAPQQQYAPQPAPQQYAQPVQQQAPPQAQQAAPMPQVAGAPAPAQQAAPQPPSDLSPEQQALLARLTGGQPAA